MPDVISTKEFGGLMAMLRASFTRDEMTAESVAVYYGFLKHIPAGDLRAAVNHLISTKISPVFPTVAEIKLLAEGKAKMEVQAGAMEAWNKANAALIAGPAYQTDPIVNAAIKLAFGGWAGFGNLDPEDTFARHRFSEAYQIIVTDDQRLGEIKRLAEDKKALAALTEGETAHV